jgi:hypothetical protein
MDNTQANTLLKQIGGMNILAISGGRKVLVDGTLVLPVGCGYTVEVDYCEGSDTYTVRRVFARGGKRWVKGELTYVYADEVGEAAYQAHAFRSYDFPKGAAA